MAEQRPVRVWDAPVRIVHWLIALAMPALWWTAQSDHLDWHHWLGYGVLGLVLFRLAWGFVGGSTARFSNFMRGPRAVAAYAGRLLRGEKETAIGHNPMGGWSVAALLALVLAETGLGLFSVDTDGLAPGPLSRFVSYDGAQLLTQWHHWLFYALLALIGLHLAAIAFYVAVKRDDLVGPMLSGARTASKGVQPLTSAPVWRALLVAAGATALTVWIARGLR